MVKIPPHRAIRSPVTLFKVRHPEEESWSARLWREKTPGGEGQSIGMAHRVCAAEDAIALQVFRYCCIPTCWLDHFQRIGTLARKAWYVRYLSDDRIFRSSERYLRMLKFCPQ